MYKKSKPTVDLAINHKHVTIIILLTNILLMNETTTKPVYVVIEGVCSYRKIGIRISKITFDNGDFSNPYNENCQNE